MKDYIFQINLYSDTLTGSGEGYGAVIDDDIVFDDFGLPFIPAKRIKGCLRESAEEVCHMMYLSQVKGILKLSLNQDFQSYQIILNLFGIPGQRDSAPLEFSNLMIGDYKDNRAAISYFQDHYPEIVTKEGVLQTFTRTRQHTAINPDSGTAKEHSLRTYRVLKAGNSFFGKIQDKTDDLETRSLLVLAAANLRKIGTSRTRGYGEVECFLHENGKILKVTDIWRKNGQD